MLRPQLIELHPSRTTNRNEANSAPAPLEPNERWLEGKAFSPMPFRASVAPAFIAQCKRSSAKFTPFRAAHIILENGGVAGYTSRIVHLCYLFMGSVMGRARVL